MLESNEYDFLKVILLANREALRKFYLDSKDFQGLAAKSRNREHYVEIVHSSDYTLFVDGKFITRIYTSPTTWQALGLSDMRVHLLAALLLFDDQPKVSMKFHLEEEDNHTVIHSSTEAQELIESIFQPEVVQRIHSTHPQRNPKQANKENEDDGIPF